jgi:hypothetical protein
MTPQVYLTPPPKRDVELKAARTQIKNQRRRIEAMEAENATLTGGNQLLRDAIYRNWKWMLGLWNSQEFMTREMPEDARLLLLRDIREIAAAIGESVPDYLPEDKTE